MLRTALSSRQGVAGSAELMRQTPWAVLLPSELPPGRDLVMLRQVGCPSICTGRAWAETCTCYAGTACGSGSAWSP